MRPSKLIINLIPGSLYSLLALCPVVSFQGKRGLNGWPAHYQHLEGLKTETNNIMKLTLTFLFILVASWPLVLCAKEESMSKDSPLPQVPAVETRSRFAALDDVRLLANGLLQLGHSLRDFVHKTKSQINDIFQKLNIFDSSFNQLSVLASEIKGEEEELKKTTVVLKANNEEIRNLSLEINSKVESILQERSQLRSKVGGLEVKLSGLSQGLVPAEQLAEINSLKVSHPNLTLTHGGEMS